MPRSATRFVNSLKMAVGTAVVRHRVVFVGAYLLEKTRGADWLRAGVQLLAMLPMAVPGLVLGLGYIFFFNAPDNPLNGLYHTMTILVLCTIVHFYTTGHLTAVTALKALDAEFEAVSASLKVPFYKTFWRVTLPICTPALVDIEPLLLRQRDDHDLGGGVPLLARHQGGVDRHPQPGRGRRDRRRRRDGDADRRDVDVVTLLFIVLGRWLDRRTQAWRASADG